MVAPWKTVAHDRLMHNVDSDLFLECTVDAGCSSCRRIDVIFGSLGSPELHLGKLSEDAN